MSVCYCCRAMSVLCWSCYSKSDASDVSREAFSSTNLRVSRVKRFLWSVCVSCINQTRDSHDNNIPITDCNVLFETHTEGIVRKWPFCRLWQEIQSTLLVMKDRRCSVSHISNTNHIHILLVLSPLTSVTVTHFKESETYSVSIIKWYLDLTSWSESKKSVETSKGDDKTGINSVSKN